MYSREPVCSMDGTYMGWMKNSAVDANVTSNVAPSITPYLKNAADLELFKEKEKFRQSLKDDAELALYFVEENIKGELFLIKLYPGGYYKNSSQILSARFVRQINIVDFSGNLSAVLIKYEHVDGNARYLVLPYKNLTPKNLVKAFGNNGVRFLVGKNTIKIISGSLLNWLQYTARTFELSNSMGWVKVDGKWVFVSKRCATIQGILNLEKGSIDYVFSHIS